MSSKFLNSQNVFCNFLLLFLFFVTYVNAAEKYKEKPLVVLITSYNNQDVVQKNLESVFMQNYSNYRIIYVDDCSTDGTQLLVSRITRKINKFINMTYIRNRKRMGALANIYHAIHSCGDNEIIVSLDGDDWFSRNDVLQKINETYTSEDIWLTHGSLVEFPNGSISWSIPIPQKIIESANFRSYRCPSHLRTFYAWLFKQVKEEDLKYQGEFFSMAWDQAIMFPMIEMAAERHRFIPEVLYVYNVANPLNDNKVNPQLQRFLEEYIRSMPCYSRLEKNPLE